MPSASSGLRADPSKADNLRATRADKSCATNTSINELYSARHDDGLFAQNLRTFIPNKKVDDAIRDSIRSTPADFWLKNNGITIACEDYYVDGNKIVLYNFSIINGCQTATKIGKSLIDADFVLPCKIIRESESQKMADLAEAANSQKPIQDRDLKSNAPEQLALKRAFEKQEPKIYLGVKRGVKQFTRPQRMARGIRDWQQLDNWTYGQLVLAFHRQKPHIAFSRRGTIFGTKETYKEVFLRAGRDLATETDLLRLHDCYIQWRETLLEDEGIAEKEQAIVNQGRFAILANCGLLIKAKRKLLDLATRQNRDHWARELVRTDLTGSLFPPNGVDLSEETERRLHDLFTLLLELHQSVVGEDNVAKLYKSEDFYLGPLTQQLVFRWQNNPYARFFSEAAGAFL
ncbi:MAG: AIPR family protein [Gammaproteobacteria bacterium]|nr:AIPR family protein [Gammaproteobacteria bacterium]